MTQALNGPGMSVRDRSRSMYFRAKAHLALQHSGLAMSDAGVAIWLKGLTPAEAADAEAVKAQAMASAGVVAGAVPVKPVMLNPVAAMPVAVVPVPLPKAAVLPPAAWPSADVVQAETPKLQVGAPIVAVAPVAAPPWTASAVQREALSQVAVPQETVTPAVVKAAIASNALVGERPLETGSIGRFGAAVVVPESVPVVQPVAVAPVIVPVAKVEPAPSQVTAAPVAPVASGGLIPILGGLSAVGGMFAPPPSPYQAEIERANERQDRYAAKVREHNRDLAKRNAGWSAGQTVAGEGR